MGLEPTYDRILHRLLGQFSYSPMLDPLGLLTPEQATPIFASV